MTYNYVYIYAYKCTLLESAIETYVPIATGLSMNTNSLNTTADIHLVLSKSELEEIFNVDITALTVSSYFTQHPNQTQAVSELYYSGLPGSCDTHMTSV
jgi:hypothetical protein